MELANRNGMSASFRPTVQRFGKRDTGSGTVLSRPGRSTLETAVSGEKLFKNSKG